MSRYHLSPLAILFRTLLASAGGLVLAFSFCAGAAIALGQLFGMSRAEAVVLTTMLAYLVWMVAVLIAYAAATTRRAAAWVLGSAAFFAALAWGLGPLPAPGIV